MSLKPEKIDFDEVWGRLRIIVDNVIRAKNMKNMEWTAPFSDVYKICVAFPEPLCDRLYKETKQFLEQHVRGLYEEVRQAPKEELLQTYYNCWRTFFEGVDYLNKLFHFLNAQYIEKQKFSEADMFYGCIELEEQKLEIRELGYHTWEQVMLLPITGSLVELLLVALEADRAGNEENRQILHSVIHSFIRVEDYKKKYDLYRNSFETPFIEATGRHYKTISDQLLSELDCPEYMKKVIVLLQLERDRSQQLLHSSSMSKLMRECETRLIADHLPFLHSKCAQMVQNEERENLANMFTLLKNVKDALNPLMKELQDYIAKVGQKAVNQYLMPPEAPEAREVPTQFVENILEIHKKYWDIIKEVFDSNQKFRRALDNAFATIVNGRPVSKQLCRAPELLARYCDLLLKKSALRGLLESELEERLRESITVFKYLDDKDVFQKYYAKMLCKRLIHQQSVSMESEEDMINKLKSACGHEFTAKLHRMFTDIRVSDDLNKSFATWVQADEPARALGNINFNIFVLQAGAWPLSTTSSNPFQIPQALEKCVLQFEAYYYSKFSGRLLTWLHFLSTCEVKVTIAKKTYLITMGSYFMGIMLLFEDSDTLTYSFIAEHTKLIDEQLVKHLAGLVEAKLLIAEDGAPDVSRPEARFSLNHNYTNKRTKFKITAIPQKECSQQQTEAEQTHASVEEDRKLFLQAAIVRIMKGRRVISHSALVEEVITMADNRFTPSVPMIKKCVEALMDKQYLERSADNPNQYSYVS